MVFLLDVPAAIVDGGDSVLARNDLWASATGSPGESGETLTHCLRHFSMAPFLIAAMSRGPAWSGAVTGMRVNHRSGDQREGNGNYTAHWRRLPTQILGHELAIISLHHGPESGDAEQVISSLQARISGLLIRQTLIEESERRRIGVALHDTVLQSLALVRASLLGQERTEEGRVRTIETLDGAIEQVRTLSFDLSPPILRDLGLYSALRWLAENHNQRHDAPISLSCEGGDPDLPDDVRTVVFRALGELITNSSKHAPDAKIAISCATASHGVRIVVEDDGPGFDVNRMYAWKHESAGFGLLSVEQQVRAIDGSFELVSSPGHGTKAAIMIPVDASESSTDA